MRLSDEAAEGLGKLARNLDETQLRGITNSIPPGQIDEALAAAGLGSRHDQLLASREEFSNAHVAAHAASVHLLADQIAARQLAGVQSRPVSEDELDALAQDTLRLLVHVVQLQELWGEDPALERGQGHWWFIERYAGRAAERLESVMLDSHNYGLAPELLVLLEMRAVAVTARSGDPAFAKEQLDQLAAMLALLADAERFVSDQRDLTQGVGKWLARVVATPPVRTHVAWPLTQLEVRRTAGALDARLKTSPAPAALAELIDNNPRNDVFGVLLVVGFKKLPPSVSSYLAQSFYFVPVSEPNRHALGLIIGVAGPENSSEFGALILLSLIPGFDLLNDLGSLLLEDDPFVTTVAAVGLALTLVEIGVILFPGAATAGTPVTIADSTAAAVKASYKAALASVDDDVAQGFVRAFADLNEEAAEASFDLTADLVSVLSRRVIAAGDEASPEAFEALLRADLWENYFHYVEGVGRNHRGFLEAVGFDEGAELIGQVFRQNDALADEIAEAGLDSLKRFGDELFESGVDFSDDAAAGLAKAFDDVGQAGVDRIAAGLRHADGTFDEEQVELALDLVRRAGFEWTDEALEGVGRSARLIGADGTSRIFNLGDDAREAFTAVTVRGEGIWDEITGEGLARVFERQIPEDLLLEQGEQLSAYYLRVFKTYEDDVTEDVLRVIADGDPSTVDHVLQRITTPRDAFQWRYRGNSLEVLEQRNVFIDRQVWTQADYQRIRQRIFNNWNDGEPIDDPRRLAEAFALEAGDDYLSSTDMYDDIIIRTHHPGIDGAARRTRSGTPVVLEGKGTYTGAELRLASFFKSDELGLETTREWILERQSRHLTGLLDEEVPQVLELLNAVDEGDAYEVVILRGGYSQIGGSNPLDLGQGLDEFIHLITPVDDEIPFSVRFVFINLLGN